MATAAVAAGALAVMLARLLPDVAAKPLVEDEAVAGLVAARPLPELLATVLLDRGGAPLHFVLAHGVFALDASATALRWLSVAAAAATVAICFDLGRRLAGPPAGAVAAVIAATSTVIAVYGTFGRMYALLACVAALAVDLFVRAYELRTTRSAALAAAAAWLLPATHPYGIILVGAEAVVALVLWRGRPLRAALVPAAFGLALVPFVVADLRLADRFAVGTRGEEALATPGEAISQSARALASFAGGSGVTFVLFAALGVVGLACLVRTGRAFAAVTLVALVAPPLLLVLVQTGSSPGLSPRHLAFALPLWAATIGVGAAACVRRLGRVFGAAALVGVAAVAALAPAGGIRDPRDRDNVVLGGGPEAQATGGAAARGPAATWLSRTIERGDILLPYSAVFLAALPDARQATALPYTQPEVLAATLARAERPARALVVAVPLGTARVDAPALRSGLAPADEAHVLGRWLLLRSHGPFRERTELLTAACRVLSAAQTAVAPPLARELRWYLRLARRTVTGALRDAGGVCPPAAEAAAAA